MLQPFRCSSSTKSLKCGQLSMQWFTKAAPRTKLSALHGLSRNRNPWQHHTSELFEASFHPVVATNASVKADLLRQHWKSPTLTSLTPYKVVTRAAILLISSSLTGTSLWRNAMTRSRKLTKTIHLSRFSIDSILRKAADMFADHFSDVYLKDELLTATWRSMTISMREIHDKPNNPPAMSATTGPSRTSQL